VYELWDDEASLAAHFQHPNYHAMRAALQGQGIVGTANRMFLVARDEPVYGPQGQIRDRFFVDAPSG
jgi:heme-degrading monooxygenase HmoA